MKTDTLNLSQAPAVCRNVTETPHTLSARKSLTALIRAFTDTGYAQIGRAVGHAKSWVSRWLSGELVANLPELLTMLDTAGLRIVHEDDLAAGTNGEVVERLESVIDKLTGIESAMAAMDDGGALHAQLLSLAIEALKARLERAA